MNKKNVLIGLLIILIVIAGALAIKKLTNREIRKADELINAIENRIQELNTEGVEVNTNLFDKLNLNTNATGDVRVNSLGDTIMALKVDNRCIKKYHNSEVGYDTYKNDDDCTISTPDRCFEYEEGTDGLTITNYLCGSTYKSAGENDLSYNADGEYLNVVIPSTIDGKTVTSIAPFAFSPYTSKKDMSGSYKLDKDKKVGIKYIDIPNTIKIIGTYAFSSNILDYIYIKDGVQNIKSEAFSRNLLTGTIELSRDNVEVANYAFSDNDINEFVLGKNTKNLGQGILYNNANLKRVVVNDNLDETSIYWPLIITSQYNGDISAIEFTK